MKYDWIIEHTFNSEKQTLISKKPFNELFIFCFNLKHFDKNIKQCISEGKPAGLYFLTKVPNIEKDYARQIVALWKNLEHKKIIKIDFKNKKFSDDRRYTDFFQITFLIDYFKSVKNCLQIILGTERDAWKEWKNENGESIKKYRKQAENDESK